MASILDALLAAPSPADRFMQLMPLLQGSSFGGVSTGSGLGSTPSGAGGPGSLVTGQTDYNYRTWPKPYGGVPSNLVTRQGITMQRGPMRSLMEIARASNVLPGAREIGQITGGYRHEQPAGNPMAAPENMSYHEQGLAVDASWWTQHPELARALAQAGWNRFSPSTEPWHWSYGVTG